MQPKLWREPRAPKRPRETLVDRYDRQNREAAAVILANPRRYAGLPYEWATLWSQKKGRRSSN